MLRRYFPNTSCEPQGLGLRDAKPRELTSLDHHCACLWANTVGPRPSRTPLPPKPYADRHALWMFGRSGEVFGFLDTNPRVNVPLMRVFGATISAFGAVLGGPWLLTTNLSPNKFGLGFEQLNYRYTSITNILRLPSKGDSLGLPERPGGFATSIGSRFRGLRLTVWGLGFKV